MHKRIYAGKIHAAQMKCKHMHWAHILHIYHTHMCRKNVCEIL